MKVNDVLNRLCRFAPTATKEDFDNVGLLIGSKEAEVSRVLVSLDITMEVAQEAKEKGAQLIVTHHPAFFELKSVVAEENKGELIHFMVKNGLSVICMHTNLDKAIGGVNDMLAKAVGIKEPQILLDEGANEFGEHYGICRYGELEREMELEEFLRVVKANLAPNGIRYNSCGKKVKKVCVGGGSCGDFIPYAVAKGCDTFLSADLKYNMFLSAPDTGMNIIDAGHYPTENTVCPKLRELVAELGLDVSISEKHREHVEYHI